MSIPVVTDKWAGSFDCHVCRRKRLMGIEFSKKALERHRKDGAPLKCKKCVQETEESERADAARARSATVIVQEAMKTTNASRTLQQESRICAACRKTISIQFYNKNQWNKGEGKSKCQTCVEQSLASEAQKRQESKDLQLQNARANVLTAQASGNVAAVFKAESELAALEAELVTGLKPIKMGRQGSSFRGGSQARAGGPTGRR